jgi:protein phosphatase-4 regulatory subunit 3
VASEENPERILLETKISKDDGYQKQQETLIVWTEQNGTDMALSFQEADGCAAIWDFVSRVQQHLLAVLGPDDPPSDDAMDGFPSPVMLPDPELDNLIEVEGTMRLASGTPHGRDSLTKFVLQEDYLRKLVPLVDEAERKEFLPELHRLSNIMKTLVLLNDTQIIEQVVSDPLILGVAGALEYDQEFPQHKANHRQYLKDHTRFKEVVPIQDENIKSKIHCTWRLQYLKDVILARILDDPTFAILNSLIFFNQVDIVTHLHANSDFVRALFSVVESPESDTAKRKDAMSFIQQCCAIAKNLQAAARSQLYSNFINNGLLEVINLAIGQEDTSIRAIGTDILIAMIDHDPNLVRSHVVKTTSEKRQPITDTLIDFLLSEQDQGIKSQAADALKIMLDPQLAPIQPTQDMMAKLRANQHGLNPQTEAFIQSFYDRGAKQLFEPLRNLKNRKDCKHPHPSPCPRTLLTPQECTI